jgi:hypothetical protein
MSNIYNMIGVTLIALMVLGTGDLTCAAFVIQPLRCTPKYTTTTQLAFGIPSFLTPQTPNDNNEKSTKKDGKVKSEKDDEKSVGLKGLVQLVMAGAGAPFLGDFEGVDKETGKFMFSLEANNLVDENGQSKQTSMPYFENGWVDPADLEREEQRKKNGGGFKFPW